MFDYEESVVALAITPVIFLMLREYHQSLNIQSSHYKNVSCEYASHVFCLVMCGIFSV
jgi:hypothetical protein